jgi:hypothetical protein
MSGSKTYGSDGKVATVHHAAEKGEDDTGALGVDAKMKGTNLGAKASKAEGDKPVQKPGESLTDFGARMGAWRRSRGSAVTGMMKQP